MMKFSPSVLLLTLGMLARSTLAQNSSFWPEKQANECGNIPELARDWVDTATQLGQAMSCPVDGHHATQFGLFNDGPDMYCVKYPDFVIGSESNWIGASGNFLNPRSWWSECPENQVITSVCFGNGCNLGNSFFKSGAKCRDLGQGYLFTSESVWDCDSANTQVSCPFGYAPVAVCGNNRDTSDVCQWDGCSGTGAGLGVKCQQWMSLESLDWDYSLPTVETIEIVEDRNPILGSSLELEVDFTAEASAIFQSSAAFDAQFSANGDAEAKMLGKFGNPGVIGALFGADPSGKVESFANFNLGTQASSAASFEAAAASQARATLSSRVFTYSSNPCDDWNENFVRYVHYKRYSTKNVIGTVKCCNCVEDETMITFQFDSEQTGILALHIKDYPLFNLDTIDAISMATLYLNGTIVDFSENPATFYEDEPGLCGIGRFGQFMGFL